MFVFFECVGFLSVFPWAFVIPLSVSLRFVFPSVMDFGLRL